jgi:hypothetical protein
MHFWAGLRTYIRRQGKPTQIDCVLDLTEPSSAVLQAVRDSKLASFSVITSISDSEDDLTYPKSSMIPATPAQGTTGGEERVFSEVLEVLRNIRQQEPTTTQTEVHSRLSTARNVIVFANSSGFLSWSDRYEDLVYVINELQNIAYIDSDHGGVQDIAQWCVRAYLQLLANSREDLPEVLMGKSHNLFPPSHTAIADQQTRLLACQSDIGRLQDLVRLGSSAPSRLSRESTVRKAVPAVAARRMLCSPSAIRLRQALRPPRPHQLLRPPAATLARSPSLRPRMPEKRPARVLKRTPVQAVQIMWRRAECSCQRLSISSAPLLQPRTGGD